MTFSYCFPGWIYIKILPAQHAVSGWATTSRFHSKMHWLIAVTKDFVQIALIFLENLDLPNDNENS